MPAKRLVAEVCAHHNVEGFRPYKIRFTDKGSDDANLAHMMVAAIKKEADWNGWWDGDGGALGDTSVAQLTAKVNELVASAKPGANKETTAVIEYHDDDNYPEDTIALVMWVHKTKKYPNYGFCQVFVQGNRTPTIGECNQNVDKYEAKWVSLC